VTDVAPDQELLARLRAADPASSLPPAEPGRVTELLEAAMSDTETAVRPHASRATGTHDRSPLTWLVAAAAVVLIAAGGIFAVVQHARQDPASASRATLTRLSVTAGAGRCLAPSADRLRQQQLAVLGTLVSVADGTATFTVDRWYAGPATDRVAVATSRSGPATLTEGVRLQVGDDYFIAASDGVVACGLSGADSRELQTIYGSAFG
jgi:hypothetical protein